MTEIKQKTMAIQIKTRYLILGLILALLSLFLLGWGIGSSRQKKSLTSVADSLKYEITLSKIEIDKKTVYLTKVSQELTTEKELRKKDIVDKGTLRKLNLKQVNEIAKLKFRIDTLLTDVSHNGNIVSILTEKIDSLTKDTVSVKKNAILLPFDFNKKDDYLSLDGHFLNNGDLTIDLNMSLSIDVITGIDKKTKQNTCSVFTDNPYIRTLGVRSFKTDLPREKKYGIGLSVGYGFVLDDTPHLAPYIGVGLQRSIFRF